MLLTALLGMFCFGKWCDWKAFLREGYGLGRVYSVVSHLMGHVRGVEPPLIAVNCSNIVNLLLACPTAPDVKLNNTQ
jgi:hypothetical protein